MPPRTAGVVRGPAVPLPAKGQRPGNLHPTARSGRSTIPSTPTCAKADRTSRNPRGDRVQEPEVEAGPEEAKGSETDYRFNLEAGGEKRLKGNATASKLRKVLGDDYEKLSAEHLAASWKTCWIMRRRMRWPTAGEHYGIAPQKAERWPT